MLGSHQKAFHCTWDAANTRHVAIINITQSSRTMSNVMPSLKAIPLSRGYRRHWTGGNDKVLMSSCTAFFGRSLWQLISMILSASKLLSLLNPWSSTKCLLSLFGGWKCPVLDCCWWSTLLLRIVRRLNLKPCWNKAVDVRSSSVNVHGSQNKSCKHWFRSVWSVSSRGVHK